MAQRDRADASPRRPGASQIRPSCREPPQPGQQALGLARPAGRRVGDRPQPRIVGQGAHAGGQALDAGVGRVVEAVGPPDEEGRQVGVADPLAAELGVPGRRLVAGLLGLLAPGLGLIVGHGVIRLAPDHVGATGDSLGHPLFHRLDRDAAQPRDLPIGEAPTWFRAKTSRNFGGKASNICSKKTACSWLSSIVWLAKVA